MNSTPALRTAILTILAKQDDWMNLTDLRAKFGGAISRESIDQALTDLATSRQIRLIPESHAPTRYAIQDGALYLGGEYRHVAGLPEFDN